MARPLRYQAAGAVYHVISRGEGGMTVFEDETDRSVWLARLGEVCERFGWRVHAYVLMNNHFHLLMETPEPNLVAGMKWFMGVYSQGWNRRRERRGHVFQGRYKAMIVNGEGSGEYFRIAADYIHLNPVRAGLVGGSTGKSLSSWSASSFPVYAGQRGPDWLVTERLLEAFQLASDVTGHQAYYAAYLEERAKSRKGTLSEDSLKQLRRGWYVGDRDFGRRMARKISAADGAQRSDSIGGEAARAHDADEAERLMQWGLDELGLPGDPLRLAGWGKWVVEKSLLSALVRQRTGVSNAWIAERLAMGHEGNVTRALRRVKESEELGQRLRQLSAPQNLPIA